MATILSEILPEAAARHGDRTALIIGYRRLSFRQLDALSNKVANGLVGLGIRPGDRVSPSYSSLHRVIDGLTCGRGIAVRNSIAHADRICWA